MIEHIYVIGDSHSKGFIGPGFTTYEITATAYNLISEISESNSRARIFTILEKIKKDEYVMFSFGEIDCRMHLWKHVSEERKIEDAVIECVDRYVQFLLEVKNLGYDNVIVFGPVASCLELIPGVEMPFNTTLQQRNYCAFLFNEYLEQKCEENGLIFISVFLNTVNSDLTADREMYDMTCVHLKPVVQLTYFIKQLAYYYIFKHKED